MDNYKLWKKLKDQAAKQGYVDYIGFLHLDTDFINEKLPKDAQMLEVVKKTVDIATYDDTEEGVDECHLLSMVEIAKKFCNAEEIFNESLQKDGGKNLEKQLRRGAKAQGGSSGFLYDMMYYIGDNPFFDKVLAENPDIVEGLKKYFDVTMSGLTGDKKLDDELEEDYISSVIKIADSGKLAPYFDAYAIMNATMELNEKEKFLRRMQNSAARHDGKLTPGILKKRIDEILKALPEHPEILPIIEKSFVLDSKEKRRERYKYTDDDSAYEYVNESYEADETALATIWERGLLNEFFNVEKALEHGKLGGKEGLAYDDKERIVNLYLQRDDLNIYQLRACLAISRSATEWAIHDHPEIKERVNKMLEGAQSYKLLQSFADDATLNKFFDMKERFERSAEAVQQLSGKEVYTIFTTPESEIPEAAEMNRQYRIIKKYLEQTKDLSNYSFNDDLCYTSFRKDERWVEDGGLNELLQDAGTFKGAPEITQMVDECIGRIFAHYIYDTQGRKSRFNYISTCGIDEFAKNMKEEVTADPDSPKAQFYLKYASIVLDQYTSFDRTYIETAAVLLPEMAERGRFDVCKQIFMGMKQADGYYSGANTWCLENMQKVLSSAETEKPLFKFYLQNAKEFCSTIDQYLEFAAVLVGKDMNAHPEITAQLGKEIGEMYKEMTPENPQKCADKLARIYQYYPAPEFAEIIAEDSKPLELKEENLCTYYTNWICTGQQNFSDAVERILARQGKFVYDPQDGIDYKPLLERIKQSDIKEIVVRKLLPSQDTDFALSGYKKLEKINFGDCVGVINAEALFDNPSLKIIEKEYDGKITVNNLEKLFGDALPSLEEFKLRPTVIPEQEEALYNLLMQQKPESLHTLCYDFAKEKAMNLMYKNILLVVNSQNMDTYRDSLISRNEQFISFHKGERSLEQRYVLDYAISDKRLVEALSVIPPEKRPTLQQMEETFDSENPNKLHERIKESYGEDRYQEVIQQVRNLTAGNEVKLSLDLQLACRNHVFIEHLRELPAEKRPKLSELFAAVNSQIINGTIADNLLGEDGKANRETWQRIIDILKPSDEEIINTTKMKKCSAEMKEILDSVRTLRKDLKEMVVKEKRRSAFESWKKNNTKD